MVDSLKTPTPSVTIREAVPLIDEELIQGLRASVGWSTVETGLASMAAGRSIVYVLDLDREPAASGALVLRADDPDLADGASTALISNLIVDPRFQGHGLGTRLLEHLESEALSRGFSQMSIGVDAPNVRARSLYERHGYHPLKNKREAWGEVVYLAKRLGSDPR